MLETLRQEALSCRNCPLHTTRTQVVFGEGNPRASILFLGEAPGQHEDESGRPFVGRAGQLLDKLLGKVGLDRTKVYIANTVKCRPPGNRVPTEEEDRACAPLLDRQIQAIGPQIIVTLGNTATKRILGPSSLGITKVRGSLFPTPNGWRVLPTFHPSYLLRNLSEKDGSPLAIAVQDFKLIRAKYDEIESSKQVDTSCATNDLGSFFKT